MFRHRIGVQSIFNCFFFLRRARKVRDESCSLYVSRAVKQGRWNCLSVKRKSSWMEDSSGTRRQRRVVDVHLSIVCKNAISRFIVLPGCWTGTELISPNSPTTAIRKTTTVAAVASVDDGAGHMSSRLGRPVRRARWPVCAGGVSRALHRCRYTIGEPSDFFRERMFSQRTGPLDWWTYHATVNRRRRTIVRNSDDSRRAIFRGVKIKKTY